VAADLFRRRRSDRVGEVLGQHLALVEETVQAMARGIAAQLEGAPWEVLEELNVDTHRRESRADDVRREAELLLVKGALLASTRRYLLDIVEGVDQLANSAEHTLDFLVLQRILVPDILHPLIREMIQVTLEQVGDLKGAIVALLGRDRDAVRRAAEVERKESRVDELLRRGILRLFSTDLPLAEKILNREFLEKLAALSDRAEDVSDLVVMAVAVESP